MTSNKLLSDEIRKKEKALEKVKRVERDSSKPSLLKRNGSFPL